MGFFPKNVLKTRRLVPTFAPRILETRIYNKFSQKIKVMKKDIHPSSYRFVVFKDISTDDAFLGKSCINSKDTITWEDGKEYPLVKMEISAFSHPFFTGKMKFVDTAGRIDKFNKKFAKFANTKESEVAEAE
jgi:large subunit ribosomal protein L31